MLAKLKRLLNVSRVEPENTELIYVFLPETIEPDERHARYENAIDAELQLHAIGFVSGGGTLLSEERLDGGRDLLHIGIDVDAVDVDAARQILREQLPSLGCLAGTQLHYRRGGRLLQDEYDGAEWALGRPRTMMHPGFGT